MNNWPDGERAAWPRGFPAAGPVPRNLPFLSERQVSGYDRQDLGRLAATARR
jgi:hypothetical protein